MGAWIETSFLSRLLPEPKVAPFMGAWIETCVRCPVEVVLASRLSWARGSKHPAGPDLEIILRVAPFMGAWIETCSCRNSASVHADNRTVSKTLSGGAVSAVSGPASPAPASKLGWQHG